MNNQTTYRYMNIIEQTLPIDDFEVQDSMLIFYKHNDSKMNNIEQRYTFSDNEKCRLQTLS